MTNYVLYRIYTEAGDLLYIGATTNPALRMNTHSRMKSWWSEAARIELQHFPYLDELLEAEEEAIRAEQPQYNSVGTGRRRSSMKPRQNAPGTGTLFQRASDGLWVGRVEIRCGPDGRRRKKEVSSKSYEEAVRKFEALKASAKDAGPRSPR